MDKTYLILKEVWDENYDSWLEVKKKNKEMIKGKPLPVHSFLDDISYLDYEKNMELIRDIAIRLGYDEKYFDFKEDN